jgi:hypothetical protein
MHVGPRESTTKSRQARFLPKRARDQAPRKVSGIFNSQPNLSKRIRLSSIGKGCFSHLEELIEAGTSLSEGDLSHAIRVMLKSDTLKGLCRRYHRAWYSKRESAKGLIEWT